MKMLLTLLMFILFTGCASHSNHIDEINDYSYKHYEVIKGHVFTKIDDHKDYNSEQKKELKSIIGKAIEKNRELKIEESKTAQYLLDALIAEETNLNTINSLKTKIKGIYDKKSDLFYNTASKIKKVIGIKSTNHVLTMEIAPFMQ